LPHPYRLPLQTVPDRREGEDLAQRV